MPDFARSRGFVVSLDDAGLNARGVVLCHQLCALDLRARHARFSQKAPQNIIDEVLA